MKCIHINLTWLADQLIVYSLVIVANVGHLLACFAAIAWYFHIDANGPATPASNDNVYRALSITVARAKC